MIELRPLGSLSLTGPACEELPGILRQPKRLALLAYLAAATPRGFCRRAQVHVDLPVRWAIRLRSLIDTGRQPSRGG
jgi:hypothetical protein